MIITGIASIAYAAFANASATRLSEDVSAVMSTVSPGFTNSTSRTIVIAPFATSKSKYSSLVSILNVVPDYAFAKLHGITEEQVISCANDLTLKARISTQKDGDDINIEVFGAASHASYPEGGINAIQNLFLLLKNLYPEPNSALKKSIHALANALKVETNGLSAGLFCTDEVSGELTLNTAILKIDKENHFCKFDIRYPVTHDGEELLKKLELSATECFANYKLIQHKPPLYVEKDRPFIKELQKAYEESTGAPANCISIGGGTYCRYVKNTVSFGPVFPGQKELAHQSNEYISLDDLRKIAKIYAQAIYNLIE